MEKTSKIKREVEIIKKYVHNNRKSKNLEQEVKSKFSNFEMRYPIIMKKILEGSLNEPEFNMMMSMMDKMQCGNISEHDASVHVGQVLVDKYVKPMLDEAKKEEENIEESK